MIVLKAAQAQACSDALQSVAGIVERRAHAAHPGQRAAAQERQRRLEFTTSDLEIQVRTTCRARRRCRHASPPRRARASVIDILSTLPRRPGR
jgi:hypothetical protein